jgi:septal ring factor EnvC (AmiA/AmiB activator)
MNPAALHRICIGLAALAALEITPAHAQDEITKKRSELESIRVQIKEYEDRISQQQKNEQATLELIDNYDRKGTLIRNLIGKLKGQEAGITREIEQSRKSVGTLEEHLDFLKKQYAAYVTAVYKGGRTRDLELLLSSASINQFAIRSEYLRRFTDQRRKDAQRIVEQRREVENTQARLHLQLSEEQRLLAEKGAEEERLTTMLEERKDVLGRIRKDKKQVQREIDRQLKAAKELEGIITELIEKDRIRKEREEEQARLTNRVTPPPVPTTFDKKKGKLRWPVEAGRIVAHFGAQRHPTLKTITQNTGIDIAIKAGTPVTSVADGEVATLWWLPSFGNLLIVNHYGGYRTVYTHLADITVAEGEHLTEGETIGHSGESLDGPRLHFEIWKDREKQNPELWLIHQ